MRKLFQLKAIGGATTLASASTSSELVYAIEGTDQVCIQLDGTWPGGLVITATLSNNSTFHPFPTGALTFTAVGLDRLRNVRGAGFLKLKVTVAGGSTNITPTINGITSVQ